MDGVAREFSFACLSGFQSGAARGRGAARRGEEVGKAPLARRQPNVRFLSPQPFEVFFCARSPFRKVKFH